MPINWDEFDEDLNQAITESAKATDTKLASHISSITKLTDDEINTLFPAPSDIKKLAELLKIVKSSEAQNKKVNSIINNAEKLSGVMLTLINKLT
ncbi:MAG: hypothetical protein ACJA0E_000883 [Bermanella sp.]|jgi:hypothetical protein